MLILLTAVLPPPNVRVQIDQVGGDDPARADDILPGPAPAAQPGGQRAEGVGWLEKLLPWLRRATHRGDVVTDECPSQIARHTEACQISKDL